MRIYLRACARTMCACGGGGYRPPPPPPLLPPSPPIPIPLRPTVYNANLILPEKINTGGVDPGRGGGRRWRGGGGGRVQVQCCFTSTETLRTIRDVGPRTATSTFTQFFVFQSSSSSMLLYVHRDYTDY